MKLFGQLLPVSLYLFFKLYLLLLHYYLIINNASIIIRNQTILLCNLVNCI